MVSGGANAASAESGERACDTPVTYRVYDKVPGWASTSAESYWMAGPGTIGYSETETASHTFGGSASLTTGASAIIARAEATFSVDYSYSRSKSSAWVYNIPVPSGKTSRGLVLHRSDRTGVTKRTFDANCNLSSTVDGTVWIPISATNPSSFCIIRDDEPAFSGWKSTCWHA